MIKNKIIIFFNKKTYDKCILIKFKKFNEDPKIKNYNKKTI